METDKPKFGGSFTERWIKHVRLPLKTDKPNQWSFLERLERGRSLVLVVSHGGTKSWRALWYEAGKPKSAKLGAYPDMGIADARKAASKFEPERHVASKEAGTFKQVAEDFLKQWVRKEGSKPKKPPLRSAREIERQLNVYVYPRWKDKALFDIKRKDVNKLLAQIEEKHGTRQADAVLATVRKMFNWYAVDDDHYHSPIVKGMKRGEYEPRERWLSDHEIRDVWTACDHENLYKPYGAMIKLMLLTGQRIGKVSKMKWADIDDDGVWTIPREDREKGAPPSLTLPQMARDVLASVAKQGENPYVFAGPEKKPFNSFSQRKKEIDKLLPDMEAWRHHDLRRTARALMTRRHVETEIAELALGHAITGIQRFYDKVSEYGPRVDQALEAVASEIALIVNGDDNGKIARIGALQGAHRGISAL